MMTRQPHPQGTVVTFRLQTNKPTSLVGDFNRWDPLLSPMRQASDGCCELHVLFQPGRYAFRYLADGGEWFDEPDADQHEPNGRGQAHSVLLIS